MENFIDANSLCAPSSSLPLPSAPRQSTTDGLQGPQRHISAAQKVLSSALPRPWPRLSSHAQNGYRLRALSLVNIESQHPAVSGSCTPAQASPSSRHLPRAALRHDSASHPGTSVCPSASTRTPSTEI